VRAGEREGERELIKNEEFASVTQSRKKRRESEYHRLAHRDAKKY
jgi:hypothetical protein